eukprot:PLAT4404.5.p2 GENE.PLAT4404.5~~PLAT4404.5.p2  ORF type:complete len:255 (-),score=141.65 PLAT4404.5:75-839(-)
MLRTVLRDVPIGIGIACAAAGVTLLLWEEEESAEAAVKRLSKKATALEAEGRLDEAAVHYAALLKTVRSSKPAAGATGELQPLSYTVSFRLGELYTSTRRPQLARAAYQVALEAADAAPLAVAPDGRGGSFMLAEQRPVVLDRLAQVEQDCGHFLPAHALYRQAEAELAAQLQQAKRRPETSQEELCKLQLARAGVLHNMGRLSLQIGAKEDALAVFEEAAALLSELEESMPAEVCAEWAVERTMLNALRAKLR